MRTSVVGRCIDPDDPCRRPWLQIVRGLMSEEWDRLVSSDILKESSSVWPKLDCLFCVLSVNSVGLYCLQVCSVGLHCFIDHPV